MKLPPIASFVAVVALSSGCGEKERDTEWPSSSDDSSEDTNRDTRDTRDSYGGNAGWYDSEDTGDAVGEAVDAPVVLVAGVTSSDLARSADRSTVPRDLRRESPWQVDWKEPG